jgi:hypothetical protein
VENDNDREFWAMHQAMDIIPALLQARTDVAGRFSFDSVPPDVVCWLSVKHPQHAHLSLYTSTAETPPEEYDEGHPVQKLPLAITLREVRSIPVRVVSAVSGLPKAGIEVTGYQQRATGTSAHGVTDKRGNVTLRLPPGEYELLADPGHGDDHDGFVRTYQNLVVTERKEEQPVTLKMR